MLPNEATPRQDTHLAAAIRLLESRPDFPRMQVQMRHRLEETQRNAPAEACAFGSRARLEYALRRFDVRAQAFLELVSDVETQNAFMTILDSCVQAAYLEHVGAPREVLGPASIQAESSLDSIYANLQRWIKTGYQRLADLAKGEHPSDEPTANANEMGPEQSAHVGMSEAGGSRRATVDAYIEAVRLQTGKEITRADIWRKAGYKSRSALERWERNDQKRPSQRAHQRFTQILADKPHLKKN